MDEGVVILEIDFAFELCADLFPILIVKVSAVDELSHSNFRKLRLGNIDISFIIKSINFILFKNLYKVNSVLKLTLV